MSSRNVLILPQSPNSVINPILTQASVKFKRKLISFPYPECAWVRLLSSSVAKTRDVLLKTERNGPWSGLIFMEGSTPIPRGFSAEKGVLTLNGKTVTSDLDLFYIERFEREEIIRDRAFGYLTLQEKELVRYINNILKKAHGLSTDIVTHGPYVNLKTP